MRHKLIKTIAFCWLVFLGSFFLGIYVWQSKVWPYNLLMEVKHFMEGDPAEDLSLREKIENDLNFKPSRHIRVAKRGDYIWFRFKEGFDSEKHKELKGLMLNPRRKNPKIFLSKNAPKGYRVIYGVFDFDNGLHGAIMLDPEGRITNVWQISQEGLKGKGRLDTNIFPHGFLIAPNGSIVVAFDQGNSITKYDYCGNALWRLEGMFHHSIAFDGDDAIWTWRGWENAKLSKIDFHTGQLLKEIYLQQIMEANPDIDIFGILQFNSPERFGWIGHPWHPNDIDPLPKELEPYYPEFSTGDLLMSARDSNLIFVMDPNSLKVKWWRQGLVRRQHDPDWNKKGTITIFSNNMNRGYSNITEVNPVTYEYDIVLDGEKYNFYTWWRGKHQMMPNGGALITSPDQGRVFETDGEGNITFEFLNVYGENQEYLAISEAQFFPKSYFKELPQCE